MAAQISRRSFLLLTLGAAALPLAQACAGQPQAAKPENKPAAAPTFGPAPAAAPASQPALAETKPAAPAPPAADAKPAAKPEAAIKRGGQLVQAINWTYPTMDPHLSSIQYMVGYEGMYDSLVRFELVNPQTWEFKVVGNLATSWETPDPQTAIFKLKPGVKFHDGSEFDASVAAWNFMRAKTHDKSQLKAQLSMLDTAEAVDKTTLRLKMKQPYVPLLRSMAYVTGAYVRMISKSAHDKLGDDGFANAPAGTGPFKFKQWIKDDRLILEKFPDYHTNGADGKPYPYVDEFVGRFVPDPSVSLVDLQTGSVQMLEWIATKDVTTIKSNQNLGMFEMPWAGQVYFMVSFNTEAAPFNDVRVRKAALHAIDREGMSKALGFGVGIPYYYPDWAVGSTGFDDTVARNEYNPDKTKQLLAEAGKTGLEIELKVIAREPENTIGEFAQNMWSKAGIKTKLVSLERLAWIDDVRAKKFQSCFWRGSLITSVDPELLATRIKCGGTANWGQWCDKEVDDLMNKGAAEADVKKRQDLYKQILSTIQDRAYLGTGIAMPLLTAYRKEVQGVSMNYQVPNLDRIWINK